MNYNNLPSMISLVKDCRVWVTHSLSYTYEMKKMSLFAEKTTARGCKTSGGRAMQGLATPLELVVLPYLRRRRAARPARARRESVAVVGSGIRAAEPVALIDNPVIVAFVLLP